MTDITYTYTTANGDWGWVLDEAREAIAQDGLHVVCIGPEDSVEDPGGVVSYTIGNFDHDGLPELIVVGPEPENALELLVVLSRIMQVRGRPFDVGEILTTYNGAYKVIGPVAGPGMSLMLALYHYEEMGRLPIGRRYTFGDDALPAMQVLLCDSKGRFTDDPECEIKAPGVAQMIPATYEKEDAA